MLRHPSPIFIELVITVANCFKLLQRLEVHTIANYKGLYVLAQGIAVKKRVLKHDICELSLECKMDLL